MAPPGDARTRLSLPVCGYPMGSRECGPAGLCLYAVEPAHGDSVDLWTALWGNGRTAPPGIHPYAVEPARGRCGPVECCSYTVEPGPVETPALSPLFFAPKASEEYGQAELLVDQLPLNPVGWLGVGGWGGLGVWHRRALPVRVWPERNVWHRRALLVRV